MIELFFFFFQWGTQKKQEIMHGVRLNVKNYKEDGRIFNIIYNLERSEIFWIPLGSWEIEEIFIQSVKSGKIYTLPKDLEKQSEELYWETKENKGKLNKEISKNSSAKKEVKKQSNKIYEIIKYILIFLILLVIISLIFKFFIN